MELSETERALLLEWYNQAREAFSDAYYWDYWVETLHETFGYKTDDDQEGAMEVLSSAMAKLQSFLVG